MQKRVVLVSAAAVLGLAATVLGIVGTIKSKALVSFDGDRCVYRRSPALGCGVAAALLTVAGVALGNAATAYAGRDVPATGRTLDVAVKLSLASWAATLMATVMFLYGAAMKRGTSGWSYGRRGDAHYQVCTELRSDLFAAASVLSAVATGCAIAAYAAFFQRTDEDEPAPGVAMEMGQQPQWAQQDPPPPPMANHPARPQYGHGGYGPGQPAGTA